VTRADLHLAYQAAGAMARQVAGGEVSPVELVDNALARIDEVNPSLNCFCFVWADEARAAARRAADEVAHGRPLGALHGVPIALKDTTPTAGHTTTLGSHAFAEWRPEHDASIVRSLTAAGAIVVGKTTTPEFAHSSITDSPLWGPTRNPWNTERTPGGSSGGAGAAVASGCVPLAEGTDMGGSVRIPAAWSGIVGLKPSFGRIAMDVLPGLFDSLSHHGPLARTVDDARLFTSAAQGANDADILSTPRLDALDRPLPHDVRGMRVALSVDLGCWAVDHEIDAAVHAAGDALREAGAEVTETLVACTPRIDDLWLDLWGVFMAAYFGHLVDEFGERMTPALLRLIEHGNAMSAADYKRLEIERTSWWRTVAAVLASHDAILCPTMSTAPPPAALADQPHDAQPLDGKHHNSDMTSVWNLVAPCPAISVPAGWHRHGPNAGLPIGAQIVGRRWRDDMVLQLAAAVERSGIHEQRWPAPT
jgi:Asp-tRNA(Asn)/Glu-tRNA(Gln) amidotransferase A subunit family amidase